MAEKNTANMGFEKQIRDAACVLWGQSGNGKSKTRISKVSDSKYISC